MKTTVYTDFMTAVTIANTYATAKVSGCDAELNLEITNLPVRIRRCSRSGNAVYRFETRTRICTDGNVPAEAEYEACLTEPATIMERTLGLLGMEDGEATKAQDAHIDANLQACYLMASDGVMRILEENGYLDAPAGDIALQIEQDGDMLKCVVLMPSQVPQLATIEQNTVPQGGDKPMTEEEFDALLARADAGDAGAQYEAAMACVTGNGTEPDAGRGFSYLEKAANAGYAQAEWEMGVLYMQGTLVNKDSETGLAWIRKSASHGYAQAKEMLSSMREEGIMTPEELRAAAENGDAMAQIRLGGALLHGTDGFEASFEEGLSWLEKAASEGDADLKYELSLLEYDLAEEHPELGAHARELLETAAELGNAKAADTLALFRLQDSLKQRGLIDGTESPDDLITLIKRLAEEGDGEALHFLNPSATKEN